MKDSNIALSTGEILLPAHGLNYEKWAVVACDQFTAEPDYWHGVEAFVGDAPSSLRIVLPEIYLEERKQRIREIHGAMRVYLGNAVRVAVPDGFVLTRRQTSSGPREGLLACVDLEQYDFAPGSKSLIRATEGTVPERVPPRAEIRAGAPLECPHVMMLIDDPEHTVIEPAFDDPGQELYNFDLMMGGGHVQGWALENGRALRVFEALARLHEKSDGLLYAVGDGNHSLAAAKKCWEDIKGGLSAAEFDSHPARYAMVELVNLHCPALKFEPIHRVLLGVEPREVLASMRRSRSFKRGGEDVRVAFAGGEEGFATAGHPIRPLQNFLDNFLKKHPGAKIDYIHGTDVVVSLAEKPGNLGFILPDIAKNDLFRGVVFDGVLPRKTFSMGEAHEKRYYMEAKTIVK